MTIRMSVELAFIAHFCTFSLLLDLHKHSVKGKEGKLSVRLHLRAWSLWLNLHFFFSPQAWRARGSKSIKAGDAGIKAVNVQWKWLLKTHYPDSLIFWVLWWDLTQGLLFPAVPLHLIFRKLETAVSDHIGLVSYLSLAVCTGYLKAMVISFSCRVHHRFNKWK